MVSSLRICPGFFRLHQKTRVHGSAAQAHFSQYCPDHGEILRFASRLELTLLHGGFARRVLTSRRLRSCYSSEYRTPELVHPVEGLDGNCNFSRTTGIVA